MERGGGAEQTKRKAGVEANIGRASFQMRDERGGFWRLPSFFVVPSLSFPSSHFLLGFGFCGFPFRVRASTMTRGCLFEFVRKKTAHAGEVNGDKWRGEL